MIKRTLSSDSEHEVYKLVDKTKPEDLILYLNGLAKTNNTWVGYIEETDSYEGKYGVKPETYFLINGNKIEYNLDEKTLEKKLGLKEIKLQDAEHFVDKFGSKTVLGFIFYLGYFLCSEFLKKMNKTLLVSVMIAILIYFLYKIFTEPNEDTTMFAPTQREIYIFCTASHIFYTIGAFHSDKVKKILDKIKFKRKK